jgi:hypothetical protein
VRWAALVRAGCPLWVKSRHRIASRVMSVIPADIHERGLHVRLVPIADITRHRANVSSEAVAAGAIRALEWD